MNRDPETFADFSYYLYIASAGIIVLSIAFGYVDSVKFLSQICWLALFTSGIGAFLGWAAQQDFKVNPPAEYVERRAKTGFRYNLGMFIVLVVGAIGIVTLSIMGG